MSKELITSYCSFPKDWESFKEVQTEWYTLDNLKELIAGSVCGLFTKTSDWTPLFKAIVPIN